MPFTVDGNVQREVRQSGGFVHCKRCLDEYAAKGEAFSPRQIARLQVNFDGQSIQVSCALHDRHIVTYEFVESYEFKSSTDVIEDIAQIMSDPEKPSDEERVAARFFVEELELHGYEIQRKDSTGNQSGARDAVSAGADPDWEPAPGDCTRHEGPHEPFRCNGAVGLQADPEPQTREGRHLIGLVRPHHKDKAVALIRSIEARAQGGPSVIDVERLHREFGYLLDLYGQREVETGHWAVCRDLIAALASEPSTRTRGAE